MTSLLRLYPHDWRERYEDEFLSLLADRPPDVRDRVDIVRGAFDARLRPQVPKAGPERTPASVPTRVIGLLTFLGGFVWLAALVIATNGPIVADPGGSYRDGMAAVPFLMIAMTILGVGLIQVARQLPHGSDAAGLAASAAAVTGWIWSAMPWMVPFLLVASLGWITVAISARRTGLWGSGHTAILLVGQGIVWAGLVALMLGIRVLPGPALDASAIPLVALTSVWLVVGHALIVGHRPMAAEGPLAGD